jgi:glutaminyl-tRNA synthetase
VAEPDTLPRDAESTDPSNFIRDIIDDDLEAGTYGDRVVTRFPPEPNGYLHIGHAKSIVLNFGIARDYADRAATRCHLRFDDTNPETEDMEYVRSIKDAVRWLGFDWGEHCYHAADYFEQFYDYAIKLIKQGNAYVDSLSEEEIREYRGSVNKPGRPSPYRDRSVEENLDLFERMKAGEFEDGEHVLRAKIDMKSPHMIMRDPLLYRIKHADHYRRGDAWCIYPMYDYAHCLEDAIENVTHSLCTLEFDNNRRVYDWVLEHCLDEDELPSRPRQYEFARLNLDYTIMSKRKLLQLVEEGHVDGWDDPRLPTIAGMRRRGVTPEAIVNFCEQIGVTRSESRVQISLLEHAIRDDLNFKAPRVMAALDPLKVTITNFPEGETDWIEAPHWPREIDKDGAREVPFSKTLYIECDDFRENPPEGFFRLAPGREVRLRWAYFITCDEVVRDDDGTVTELRCTYDPETRGGDAPDGRSPDATLHWVSADHAVSSEMRLYDRLFDVPVPEAGDGAFTDHLNPSSLVTQRGFIEPGIRDLPADQRVQFERQGYFWPDPEDSSPDALVYNQIVTLRDAWAEDDGDTVDMEQKRREKEEAKRRQRERSMAAQRDPVDDLTPSQRTRFDRYRDTFGLSRKDAAVMASEDPLAIFFEAVLETHNHPTAVANWILNELLGAIDERSLVDLPFSAEQFGRLVALINEDVISTRAARTVLDEMLQSGTDPKAIVETHNLKQLADSDALADVVSDVLDDNPNEVARYQDGEKKLLGFFMGQVMQATRGTANPQLTRELLQEKLNA